MHGYDATSFQLLPLVEGGTPHAFEAMFIRWSREDNLMRGQDKTMSYDHYGNLIRAKAGGDAIVWSGKRVYFKGGIERFLSLLCLFVVIFLLAVVVAVPTGIACRLLIDEHTRIVAWCKALFY